MGRASSKPEDAAVDGPENCTFAEHTGFRDESAASFPESAESHDTASNHHSNQSNRSDSSIASGIGESSRYVTSAPAHANNSSNNSTTATTTSDTPKSPFSNPTNHKGIAANKIIMKTIKASVKTDTPRCPTCPSYVLIACNHLQEAAKVPEQKRDCRYARIQNCPLCKRIDHKGPGDPRCSKHSDKRNCVFCGRNDHASFLSVHCYFHTLLIDTLVHGPEPYYCECPSNVRMKCYMRHLRSGRERSEWECPYPEREPCGVCNKDDHKVPGDPRCKAAKKPEKICIDCRGGGHGTSASSRCIFRNMPSYHVLKDYPCECPPQLGPCWFYFLEDEKPKEDWKCPFLSVQKCLACQGTDHKVPIERNCKQSYKENWKRRGDRFCRYCGLANHTTRLSKLCLHRYPSVEDRRKDHTNFRCKTCPSYIPEPCKMAFATGGKPHSKCPYEGREVCLCGVEGHAFNPKEPCSELLGSGKMYCRDCWLVGHSSNASPDCLLHRPRYCPKPDYDCQCPHTLGEKCWEVYKREKIHQWYWECPFPKAPHCECGGNNHKVPGDERCPKHGMVKTCTNCGQPDHSYITSDKCLRGEELRSILSTIREDSESSKVRTIPPHVKYHCNCPSAVDPCWVVFDREEIFEMYWKCPFLDAPMCDGEDEESNRSPSGGNKRPRHVASKKGMKKTVSRCKHYDKLGHTQLSSRECLMGEAIQRMRSQVEENRQAAANEALSEYRCECPNNLEEKCRQVFAREKFPREYWECPFLGVDHCACGKRDHKVSGAERCPNYGTVETCKHCFNSGHSELVTKKCWMGRRILRIRRQIEGDSTAKPVPPPKKVSIARGASTIKNRARNILFQRSCRRCVHRPLPCGTCRRLPTLSKERRDAFYSGLNAAVEVCTIIRILASDLLNTYVNFSIQRKEDNPDMVGLPELPGKILPKHMRLSYNVVLGKKYNPTSASQEKDRELYNDILRVYNTSIGKNISSDWIAKRYGDANSSAIQRVLQYAATKDAANAELHVRQQFDRLFKGYLVEELLKEREGRRCKSMSSSAKRMEMEEDVSDAMGSNGNNPNTRIREIKKVDDVRRVAYQAYMVMCKREELTLKEGFPCLETCAEVYKASAYSTAAKLKWNAWRMKKMESDAKAKQKNKRDRQMQQTEDEQQGTSSRGNVPKATSFSFAVITVAAQTAIECGPVEVSTDAVDNVPVNTSSSERSTVPEEESLATQANVPDEATTRAAEKRKRSVMRQKANDRQAVFDALANCPNDMETMALLIKTGFLDEVVSPRTHTEAQRTRTQRRMKRKERDRIMKMLRKQKLLEERKRRRRRNLAASRRRAWSLAKNKEQVIRKGMKRPFGYSADMRPRMVQGSLTRPSGKSMPSSVSKAIAYAVKVLAGPREVPSTVDNGQVESEDHGKSAELSCRLYRLMPLSSIDIKHITIDTSCLFYLLGGAPGTKMTERQFTHPDKQMWHWMQYIRLPHHLWNREPGRMKFNCMVETDGYSVSVSLCRNYSKRKMGAQEKEMAGGKSTREEDDDSAREDSGALEDGLWNGTDSEAEDPSSDDGFSTIIGPGKSQKELKQKEREERRKHLQQKLRPLLRLPNCVILGIDMGRKTFLMSVGNGTSKLEISNKWWRTESGAKLLQETAGREARRLGLLEWANSFPSTKGFGLGQWKAYHEYVFVDKPADLSKRLVARLPKNAGQKLSSHFSELLKPLLETISNSDLTESLSEALRPLLPHIVPSKEPKEYVPEQVRIASQEEFEKASQDFGKALLRIVSESTSHVVVQKVPRNLQPALEDTLVSLLEPVVRQIKAWELSEDVSRAVLSSLPSNLSSSLARSASEVLVQGMSDKISKVSTETVTQLLSQEYREMAPQKSLQYFSGMLLPLLSRLFFITASIITEEKLAPMLSPVLSEVLSQDGYQSIWEGAPPSANQVAARETPQDAAGKKTSRSRSRTAGRSISQAKDGEQCEGVSMELPEYLSQCFPQGSTPHVTRNLFDYLAMRRSESIRSARWRAYTLKQRTIDRFCRLILRGLDPTKTIVCLGNADFPNSIKGYAPTPKQSGIAKGLRRCGAHVYLTDEYFTSQRCSVCCGYGKMKDGTGFAAHPYFIKVCDNPNCGVILDRDVNGARNIRTVGIYEMLVGNKPERFKRGPSNTLSIPVVDPRVNAAASSAVGASTVSLTSAIDAILPDASDNIAADLSPTALGASPAPRKKRRMSRVKPTKGASILPEGNLIAGGRPTNRYHLRRTSSGQGRVVYTGTDELEVRMGDEDLAPKRAPKQARKRYGEEDEDWEWNENEGMEDEEEGDLDSNSGDDDDAYDLE